MLRALDRFLQSRLGLYGAAASLLCLTQLICTPSFSAPQKSNPAPHNVISELEDNNKASETKSTSKTLPAEIESASTQSKGPEPESLTENSNAAEPALNSSTPKDDSATVIKPEVQSPSPSRPKVSIPPNDSTSQSDYQSVVFREKPVLKLFYKNESQASDVLAKARQASAQLESAMNAADPLEPNSKLVDVIIQKDQSLDVRIRGYRIITLSSEDRKAAGFNNAQDYKEALYTDLNHFVSEEFQRLHIQKIALQFFLSVFFALMGFVIFHQARMFFNRADLMIEEKRESLKPIVLLSETLISSQTLGGLFALFLVIGRVASYVIILLTTLGAILGQFTVTRTAMSHVMAEIFTQGLKSLQSLLEALPGLLLAVILLFCWNLSLKILDLFLKGVRSGRISWSFLQEYRISVVRFWGTALSCVVFFPLIIASLFGRFDTPIETILIGAALILLLATLPILISIAAGSFMLWQGGLALGQWIKLSKIQGEIADISLHKITIVPEEGGRIHIPMSQLLFKGFTEKREYNKREFLFKVERLTPLESTLEKIETLFRDKNIEVSVACLSLSSSMYHLALTVPRFSHGMRHEVLSTLSEAHDQGLIKLSADLIDEAMF